MRLLPLVLAVLGLVTLPMEAPAQYSGDGMVDLLGNVGFLEATGAAYDASTGAVWISGSTNALDRVVELDPQSGAVRSSLALSFDPVALALDPTTGNLFLLEGNGPTGGLQLTQAGVVVSQLSNAPRVTAAACNSSGELYVIPEGLPYVDPISVQRLDKQTGSVIATYPLPSLPVPGTTSYYTGMSFDPITGRLFLIQEGTGVLYEVDPQASSVVNSAVMYPWYGGYDWQVAMTFNDTGTRLMFLSGYYGAALQLTRLRRSLEAPTRYCLGDGIAGFCPCGNHSVGARGCANSTFIGADLGVSGETLIGQDTLVLHSYGAPTGAFGIFFSGTNQLAGRTLGDGLRCAGGAVTRIESVQTGSLGAAMTTRVLSLADGAMSGSWRYYQFWYRDPQGPCGAGFNSSSAISLQWQ